MEDWKIGRLEDWKIGRLEEKNGRLEECKNVRMEDWKIGRLEEWEGVGRVEDLVLSGYNTVTHSYNTGKQGVCVQLGLHNVAEYLYLVYPDWKEVMGKKDALKQIPNAEKFDTWKYYGVDCDVGSIQKMLERYGNVPSVQWVHAAVGFETDRIIKLRNYFAGGHFLGFACSLQRLFNLLNLTQVDVLVMDVEGSEIRIFENYDWIIKPTFISVEVHGNHNNTSEADPVLLEVHTAYVDTKLQSEGYKLLKKEYTNQVTTGYCTCELQYQL